MTDFSESCIEKAEMIVNANRAALEARMQSVLIDGIHTMAEWRQLVDDHRENSDAIAALAKLRAARDGVVESHREWDMMDSKTRERVKKDSDEFSPV